MDPEHIADMGVPEPASAEGEAGEPALSLDPVGVFLQCSEAVAGGIFSGMQDLLRKKESADETACHKGASGKMGCRMAQPTGHPVPETRVLAISSAAEASADGEAGEAAPENAAWRCPNCMVTCDVQGEEAPAYECSEHR